MVEGSNVIVQVTSIYLDSYASSYDAGYLISIIKVDRLKEKIKKGDYILCTVRYDDNINENYLEAIKKSNETEFNKQDKMIMGIANK